MLAANALVYNPFDFRLYVSVGSAQGAGGNSIAVIDPYTGSIVKSIFVGSEPKRMAISDDGTSLWVALDGAAAVRQVDLRSSIAGQQFNVGSDSVSGFWYPRDVAVLPGTHDSVLVTRYSKSSSAEDGPLVYDNGVPRAYSSSVGFLGEVGVIMTYSPELVFAYSGGFPTLSTACVNANGYFAKQEASPFSILQGRYAFVQNVIYTGTGVAYDIASTNILGTYAGRGPVAADASKRRVYFLSNTMAATVSAYDMDTFLLEGSETLSVGMNVLGDNFVLWGRYGYAFRAANLIVIARSTLVAAP
jgi:DNA-binding beta-propeller fold protein YncE